ncbi:wax ester/triacylglycerol synthase family O-acyltransferase [Hoyosella subflava]|uniref:Diacylglycerol O-acyltransferase n=1 Tax=Hoyosella subflava (strain DSM 45089 / JCM 17490 / NBRC 109087 / DQS3-9A1) TaxID=443218 RepID=F6EHF7_HOYSD|nr:wax ester/triacylglycerol synthase family O-acyltransferase [Hoyosella subflava]AEF41136.1 Acyltransferase [Hoyosella subflava DQS3-9A1]
MEWEQIFDEGHTWRVRAQLADRPGSLAQVAARLSERRCNLLSVTVLPVSAWAEAGSVMDEFVLRAPVDLDATDIAALITGDGVECVGITTASVNGLVDSETAVLRAGLAALTGKVPVSDAITRLLGADSVSLETMPDGPLDGVVLSENGHVAHIPLDSRHCIVAMREWAPFADGEVARVGALLDLVSEPEPALPESPRSAARVPEAARTTRQLSSLDVQFLNAENDTTFLHVGGLTLLDPSALPSGKLTVDAVRNVIRSRLHLIGPLRWRLRKVPLGLDFPYWDDTIDPDLGYHIRSVSVPAPGTETQLCDLVAELSARQLDRSRPLWEFYLISGLADGKQALYSKVHHAVIDGVSGAEVMAAVMDLTPEPFHVPPACGAVTQHAAPSMMNMLKAGAMKSVLRPVASVRQVQRVLPHLLDIPGVGALPGAARAGREAKRLLRRNAESIPRPGTPPKVVFNERITAARSFAYASVPLSDVKSIKNALGFTVNDVVMALCTTALRQWLLDHDALPDAPIVVGMPVSVRTPEQHGTAGNQISFMPTTLPTHEPDPGRRLELIRPVLDAAKTRFSRAPASLLHDVTAMIPQLLDGIITRTVFRAATSVTMPFNLLISNVPGPQLPLYVAGARVLANYPVSVISDISGAINITVMSYDGHLDFGILACPSIIPDVESFTHYLEQALKELRVLAEVDDLSVR